MGPPPSARWGFPHRSDKLPRMGANTRSYAIVGTGAVGGYYGARLAAADCDVHFLLHTDYDAAVANGLRVETKDGDFSIAEPHVYDDVSKMPACDVVMVALKSTHNHVLAELLPPLVGPDTTVLLMQNGLGEEEKIAAIAPGIDIVGGLAFLCSHKVGPAHIRQLDYGQVRLGAFDTHGTPEYMRTIGDDLTRAGISIILEDDLQLARWKKLVWNVPYNGLCVTHATTTDVIMNDTTSRHLAIALMHEVVAGAAARACTIEAEFIQQMIEHTDNMVPYEPSMKLDYDAGRPLELDAIYANPLAAAKRGGVDLPQMRHLHERLIELDAQNPKRPA